ncbi:hypothetical protein ACFL08_00200 [Patescibacteria group bacterium]
MENRKTLAIVDLKRLLRKIFGEEISKEILECLKDNKIDDFLMFNRYIDSDNDKRDLLEKAELLIKEIDRGDSDWDCIGKLFETINGIAENDLLINR